MGAPREPRGEHERLRAQFDLLGRTHHGICDSAGDPSRLLVGVEAAHERMRNDVDTTRPYERIEGEVRRVLRARRTDGRARIAALADGSSVVYDRVLRARLTPHRDPRLRSPLPQQLQVVRERERGHREWLASRIE